MEWPNLIQTHQRIHNHIILQLKKNVHNNTQLLAKKLDTLFRIAKGKVC